ncbi:morc family cw-type zinc finger protein 3 [Phtheirospermum japonicum]|uniref:Morc family cw-type zinc finger protein 3 n=1 Tax=Phtheirospermum japonicum TaxID=374723 RepID=A0A830CYY3_9LAMI|nr:morc family cw-type zinc finger protein 3 [Phtheirospermum japonicum]
MSWAYHVIENLGVRVVKLEPGHVRRFLLEKDFGFSLRSHEEQTSHEAEKSRTKSVSAQEVALNCRHFWKAGNYDDSIKSKPTCQNGIGYLHIHPKFLHSNATSHKWVFGAVAELLDNSVDEIQNGATFVIVDKTSNPRDGAPALLIQDDGGGMDPEAMRRCISFGFSDKKSQNAIGKYGNGFKTSSMRLGADAIVFSRCRRNRRLTQSVGLLSYTFLMRTGQDKIVVPMVDYQFDRHSGTWKALHDEQYLKNNLSILLQWSPFSTEAELLKQCDYIGTHGTKVIVYNLWYGDEGKMELDFDSDPEDICIFGSVKNTSRTEASDQHLANRLRYSLRAYLSILYLRVPENFNILLCGRVVEFHNIANDLKHPEFKVYRPHHNEGEVLTTIGFLKEAPAVNIHGFNVYHKNRLILPFWHVISYTKNSSRGVVGVLEANFIEPTHNKQDFEKTPLFQKLEARLKTMTLEYWLVIYLFE